ncbi:DUF3300 domain-containing protein [Povalibacter sp.]|uniref:DUF3300 domain-containing protein n=1 Tax=Povalibacter sp. TaxID=1962978 RepID=UPI002F423EFB
MNHMAGTSAWALTVLLMVGHALMAQSAPQPADNAQPTQKSPAAFKPEELEQIVAPIALYPDALLAQVFMASTYPLEIVQAARWSREHPDVKGDAVAAEMQKQSWDPAVKSLVAFPDVLTMMNEKLDWTQKLGDAFLAQQKDVMDAVQRLRKKAKDSGNLKSSKEQTVKTEPVKTEPDGAGTAASTTTQVIVIESSDPEVVYVPTYNPTVVYGAWPYPAYPPYYYYPPAYVPGAAFFSFSMGVVVGGALWGNCNWGGNDIDIDVNRYNNFNRNEINHNRSTGVGDRSGNRNSWQHNAEHRKGVGYRDSATQQKYGRASSQQGLQSREQFRGHADQGRQQISREGAASQRDLSGNQVSTRDSGGSQYRDLGSQQSRDRAAAQSRDAGASQNRDSASQRSDRSSYSSRSSSSDAFRDVGNGAGARANSSRGGASRGGGGRRR